MDPKDMGKTRLTFDVLRGEIKRRVVVVKDILKVGRDSRSDICVEHPKVGRMHAVIEVVSPSNITVTDLGAESGTFVNGLQVNQSKIQPGDNVSLGDTTLVLVSAETTDAVAESPLVTKLGHAPTSPETVDDAGASLPAQAPKMSEAERQQITSSVVMSDAARQQLASTIRLLLQTLPPVPDDLKKVAEEHFAGVITYIAQSMKFLEEINLLKERAPGMEAQLLFLAAETFGAEATEHATFCSEKGLLKMEAKLTALAEILKIPQCLDEAFLRQRASWRAKALCFTGTGVSWAPSPFRVSTLPPLPVELAERTAVFFRDAIRFDAASQARADGASEIWNKAAGMDTQLLCLVAEVYGRESARHPSFRADAQVFGETQMTAICAAMGKPQLRDGMLAIFQTAYATTHAGIS